MPISTSGDILTFGSWTSETLTNSLCLFPSGADTSWGTLTWEQILPDANASVKVDILKASDNSVLKADLTWVDGGIDISTYAGTNDIKLKFKLYWIENSPIVKNIYLSFKYGSIYGLTTNKGKNILLDRLFNLGTYNAITNMGIGTGTTMPRVSDTALVSSSATTSTSVTFDYDKYRIKSTASFTGLTANITESGLFSSAGNYASRDVFSAISVVSGDTLTFTIFDEVA